MVKRDLIRYSVVILMGVIAIFTLGKFYMSTIRVRSDDANLFLKANDVLIYNRQESPKVNDFVVYKVAGKKYISRIIAKGGDTVTSMDDVLYINGIVKPEPYIEPLKAEYLRETNHQSNFTSDFNLEAISNMPKGRVAKNHFWVLNDNRQDEQDSRQFGEIDRSQIKGVLTFRLLPLDTFGFLENQ